MIRVAGGPILEYTLKSLHQAGFREIMMVVNHEQEGIRAHFGSGDHLNLNLEYVVQESPKGIGNALWTCRSWLENEPFCLVYGDVLTDGNPFICLLYTSPSPRDAHESRMPSSA